MKFKKYGGRKRSYKRRSFKRKRTFGKKIKSTVSRLAETKWISFAQSAAISNTSGTAWLVNGLVRGTDRDERVGSRIRMKSLMLNIQVQPNATALLDTRVRMLVIRDKQANATALVGTDVVSSLIAEAYWSTYNSHTVPKRYSVLLDKMMLLKANAVGVSTIAAAVTTTNSTMQGAKYFRKLLKLKNREVVYNDQNQGTIVDIISNSLYILWFTNQGAAQAPAVYCDYLLKYQDI